MNATRNVCIISVGQVGIMGGCRLNGSVMHTVYVSTRREI